MELLVLFLGSALISLLAYGAVRFFLRPLSIGPERYGYQRQEQFIASVPENYDYKTIGLTTEQATRAFAKLPKVTQDHIARVHANTKNERAPEMAEKQST